MHNPLRAFALVLILTVAPAAVAHETPCPPETAEAPVGDDRVAAITARVLAMNERQQDLDDRLVRIRFPRGFGSRSNAMLVVSEALEVLKDQKPTMDQVSLEQRALAKATEEADPAEVPLLVNQWEAEWDDIEARWSAAMDLAEEALTRMESVVR